MSEDQTQTSDDEAVAAAAALADQSPSPAEKAKAERAAAKAAKAAGPAVLTKTNSSGKVYVGCRHPHGVVLQVGDVSVTLKGMNSATIIGGHGVTEVAEDFWEAWRAAHSDWPMVVNGVVFAQGKVADLAEEAKDLADEKTGFERLDPTALGVEKAQV